jgi:hypothetical protein
MEISVDSQPWAIVYPEGGRPGRTPLGGIRISAATRKVDLRRPDGAALTIFIRFQAAE